MKRQVSLEEISDGRLYGKNDMVRADCGGCRGCSACCSGMGNSIILDPLDVFRLTLGLGLPFEALLEDKIELNVVDGVILPNLKMSAESETCAFLDKAGRCSIHALRPGICRLFPLGRYYLPTETAKPAAGSELWAGNLPRRQAAGFRYFLQVHECPMPNKTKVKVGKWVDTPNLDCYERFVNDWHYFLEDVQSLLWPESNLSPKAAEGDGSGLSAPVSAGQGAAQEDAVACYDQEIEEKQRKVNLLLLELFYVRPYENGDFYGQFEERLAFAKKTLDFPG